MAAVANRWNIKELIEVCQLRYDILARHLHEQNSKWADLRIAKEDLISKGKKMHMGRAVTQRGILPWDFNGCDLGSLVSQFTAVLAFETEHERAEVLVDFTEHMESLLAQSDAFLSDMDEYLNELVELQAIEDKKERTLKRNKFLGRHWRGATTFEVDEWPALRVVNPEFDL